MTVSKNMLFIILFLFVLQVEFGRASEGKPRKCVQCPITKLENLPYVLSSGEIKFSKRHGSKLTRKYEKGNYPHGMIFDFSTTTTASDNFDNTAHEKRVKRNVTGELIDADNVTFAYINHDQAVPTLHEMEEKLLIPPNKSTKVKRIYKKIHSLANIKKSLDIIPGSDDKNHDSYLGDAKARMEPNDTGLIAGNVRPHFGGVNVHPTTHKKDSFRNLIDSGKAGAKLGTVPPGTECDFEKECVWEWTKFKNDFHVVSAADYKEDEYGPLVDADNNHEGELIVVVTFDRNFESYKSLYVS